MRNLVAACMMSGAALLAGTALAADPPKYYDVYIPDVPEVDYGLGGSFYLRGSAAWNAAWAKEVNHPSVSPTPFEIDDWGYGYSFGAGVGYETGDGLRFDVTVDRLENNDMAATITGAPPLLDGRYRLNLRSTIALANVYYDFGLDGLGLSAAGGTFGYVGAGIGAAWNDVGTSAPAGAFPDPGGSNVSLAGAIMAGVGYDFGALVADLGYRGLYINKIENSTAPAPYSIDHAFVHELRATARYRFN